MKLSDTPLPPKVPVLTVKNQPTGSSTGWHHQSPCQKPQMENQCVNFHWQKNILGESNSNGHCILILFLATILAEAIATSLVMEKMVNMCISHHRNDEYYSINSEKKQTGNHIKLSNDGWYSPGTRKGCIIVVVHRIRRTAEVRSSGAAHCRRSIGCRKQGLLATLGQQAQSRFITHHASLCDGAEILDLGRRLHERKNKG